MAAHLAGHNWGTMLIFMSVGDSIDRHNYNPEPLIRTASARDILEQVTRALKTPDKRQSV
jgi:hypothetical protein